MENITENNEIELNTQKDFDAILLKFLLHEPFFSHIVRCMRKEMTYSIPTAGVSCANGDIVLYWNPNFLSKLTTKKVFGLLKHECYHLIYQHVTSRKQDPHLMWNIATDLAINSTIPKSELPDGGLIPGERCIEVENSYAPEKAQQLSDFIASLPKGKSSEWYMETIMSSDENQELIKEMFTPPSLEDLFGSGDGDCNGNSDGNGNGDCDNDANDGKKPGKGTCAGFDYHFNDESSSPGDKAMVDAKIKDIIKKAAQRCDRSKNWGSVSSAIRQEIIASFADEINWKAVLRYFCGTKQKANRTRSFKKINRKYPYIHPGRKTKYTSNIAIYIDQSGSVDDVSLQDFFSSLNDLVSRVNFTVYHFDCTVDEDSKHRWTKNKKITKAYRTRSGGTDFDVVEDHFRKVSSEYDGYIIMTDGYAPKPKTCISKRCWVLLPGVQQTFQFDKRDTVVKMTRGAKTS